MKTVERTVEIVNRLGLHARAAAKLVTTAAGFEADVRVRKDGREVSGKSIMGRITLVADGEDAGAAIEALVTLVADRFGEEA